MFDPRLLKNEYPCHAAAYVEIGTYRQKFMSTGKVAEGHWIKGVAAHVDQGSWVWFIGTDGEWYKIQHSEQLRCYGKYHLPNKDSK